MSMVPMVFRDWWDDFDRPSTRLWDQSNFGLGLRRNELLGLSRYSRPWLRQVSHHVPVLSEDTATAPSPNAPFSAVLDVQQFTPAELSVKVSGGAVVVEGRHEERADEHGYVARHFVRRYVLPEEFDLDQVNSSLSSDGVLTISAPRKGTAAGSERVVHITHTGLPATKPLAETVQPPQSPQPITTFPQ